MVPRLLCPGLPDQIRKREQYDKRGSFHSRFCFLISQCDSRDSRNWLRERAFRSLRTAWPKPIGQAKRNTMNKGFHSLDPALDTWPLPPPPCLTMPSVSGNVPWFTLDMGALVLRAKLEDQLSKVTDGVLFKFTRSK